MFETGIQLRNLRKRRNFTLDQLAERSGIDRGTISRIELGHVSPRVQTLESLCLAMDTPLPAFFVGEGRLGGTDPAFERTPARDPDDEREPYWPVPGNLWNGILAVVKRMETLLESSRETILVVDHAGRLVYTSPASDRLLGQVNGPGQRLNFLDLVHPWDQMQVLDNVINASPARPSLKGIRLRTVDGDWLSCDFTVTDHRKDPAVRAVIFRIGPASA